MSANKENVALGQTMVKTAQVLRTVTGERDALKLEVEGFKKEARANHLVSRMVERGIVSEADRIEKVAELKVEEDLTVIEKALDLSTPGEMAKIASLGGDDKGTAGNALETFLLSS